MIDDDNRTQMFTARQNGLVLEKKSRTDSLEKHSRLRGVESPDGVDRKPDVIASDYRPSQHRADQFGIDSQIVLINLDNAYSLSDVPLILVPLIAYVGRTKDFTTSHARQKPTPEPAALG